MEYEIVEPIDGGLWPDEWRNKPALPVDRDDMRLMAMEIPESEEI